MKTKIITCIIAMALFTPAIAAVDIPKEGSSTCDSSTLKSSSGNVALEADWSANTIDIAWDGNGGSTPTNGAASCTYDDTFVLPTKPSRTGYTFAGWTVKAAQSCLANVPNAVFTESFDYGEVDDSVYTENGQNGSWFGDLITEWHYDDDENTHAVADTTYGRVAGVYKCSSTSGTFATAGNPSDENGKYCWCALTSYTPNGGSQCNVSSPIWVGGGQDWEDEEDCANGCSMDGCLGFFASSYADSAVTDFRRAMFGVN